MKNMMKHTKKYMVMKITGRLKFFYNNLPIIYIYNWVPK